MEIKINKDKRGNFKVIELIISTIWVRKEEEKWKCDLILHHHELHIAILMQMHICIVMVYERKRNMSISVTYNNKKKEKFL